MDINEFLSGCVFPVVAVENDCNFVVHVCCYGHISEDNSGCELGYILKSGVIASLLNCNRCGFQWI